MTRDTNAWPSFFRRREKGIKVKRNFSLAKKARATQYLRMYDALYSTGRSH